MPCLLITKVLKVPGHQQVWCRQCKINNELIWGIGTSYGVMNLLNNGPDNSLLSDGAKPQPDPMLTSSYDIYRWWKTVWMNNFQNVTRLQWVLSGKALYVQILLILAEGNFFSIYNGYFHLKFKHVNKSHISFKGFIVDKSWWLFQMPWIFSKIYCPVAGHRLCTSLVSPPQFSRRWQPEKRKRAFVNLSNAIPPHSS